MIKRGTIFIIIFVLMFTALPMDHGWAAVGDLTTTGTQAFTPEDPVGTVLTTGQKNVDYESNRIDFAFDTDLFLQTGKNLNSIKIYASDEDETYKFDISLSGRTLRLKIKEDGSGKPYYKLQKHTLYKIVIPANLLKSIDAARTNPEMNFTFATNTDTGTYRNDILRSIAPANGVTGIDYKNGTITYEFIDSITLNASIQDYIEITTAPLTTGIPGYTADNIGNYNIRGEGNKLILTSKDGKFKDFAVYTVKLKNEAVYLSKTDGTDAVNRIHNEPIDVNFTTNYMVEITTPVNNGENIGVEPTITFTFKYPINFDQGKIKLVEQTTNTEIPIDMIVADKTLTVSVKEGAAYQPLKKNTSYRATILVNGVTFITYPAVSNTSDIHLDFKTGNLGDHPMPSAYGSSESFGDDMRDSSKTKLSPNGYIYIKMNRPVQWDKDWDGDSNKETRKAEVHLYKLPLSQNKGYTQKGEMFDKDYEYIRNTTNGRFELSGSSFKEEVILEEVEIVGTNKDILRIKPKLPFLHMNQYQLTVNKDILEDQYGHNLSSNVDFYFWTQGSGNTTIPVWSPWNMGAAKVEEITGTTHKKYRAYGTPKYSPIQPIILNVTGEIVPIAASGQIQGTKYSNNALEKILLRPTYYEEKTLLVGSLSEGTASGTIMVDTTARLSLAASANPSGDTVRWVSNNTAIATVDDNGRVKGVTRGSTQVVALDKIGNLLGQISITVEDPLHIKNIKMEYSETTQGKNTKIYLYPNSEFASGKSYKLYLPDTVFQTRGKINIAAVELELVPNGDMASTPAVEDIENGIFTVGDLITKSEVTFWIKGSNFDATVVNVELISADKTITIDPQYVQYVGTDQLKVVLKDTFKVSLASEANVGTYEVRVNFAGNRTSVWESTTKVKIESMGSPTVVSKYPDSGGNYDEKTFLHSRSDSSTSGRYFLRLTFRDDDGNLRMNGDTGLSNMMDSTVISAGSGISVLDAGFIAQIRNKGDYERDQVIGNYLLVKDTANKQANLYIPIQALRTQTTYQVTLRAGILRNTIGENSEITYSFNTRAVPFTTIIEVGSVAENYDIYEPILIKGDQVFANTVQVYFNETPAYQVTIESISSSDGLSTEKYLKVYLPRGSSKLKAGVYNVSISNGSNHQSVLYGSFSVVASGGTAPNDQEWSKGTVSEGEIKANVKLSQDTLMMDASLANAAYVPLNLDELMGQNVWVRKISYEGDKRDKIGILETKSKWANITLYGVTVDSNAVEDQITLTIGRTEPKAAEIIHKKLKGSVKSDPIQVIGTNVQIQNIALSIPYKNSSGKNLKVYRYDEVTRSVYEIKGTVNLVNQRVDIMSSSPGIFIIAE